MTTSSSTPIIKKHQNKLIAKYLTDEIQGVDSGKGIVQMFKLDKRNVVQILSAMNYEHPSYVVRRDDNTLWFCEVHNQIQGTVLLFSPLDFQPTMPFQADKRSIPPPTAEYAAWAIANPWPPQDKTLHGKGGTIRPGEWLGLFVFYKGTKKGNGSSQIYHAVHRVIMAVSRGNH